MKQVRLAGAILMLLCSLLSPAQQTVVTAANAVVPPLVRFSGVSTDVDGKPLTGVVGITFYLYKDQQGGSPLWLETQNVQPDAAGHYTVLLGSTSSQGLPASIFTSGEAHWLGVQVQGQEEQPRVLLVSAPYALKAADAETVGGLPPSAFVLAASVSTNAPSNSGNANADSGVATFVSGSGTTDFVPLWTANSVLGNSALFQSGSGSSAMVGINTTTPAATLDVNGGVIPRGALQLPSIGTATAGSGFNSQPFSLQGSAFNSGTGKAIGPLFQWQTEPSGNDTSNPAGTLNLLYGTGSGSPSETGLNIASNGKITFATGQTFPGAGTVTSVGSGAGLTGGPITGSGTLSIASGGVTNAMLANSSLTITAGTDLSGGGTVALGGSTTLNLNTTATDARYAQLGANNTLTGVQTINNQENITANNSTQVLDVTQSGAGNGISANTASSTGYGLVGSATATTGTGTGVQGVSYSTNGGYGVMGTANNVGVFGSGGNTSGYGVEGVGLIGVVATGNEYGVYAVVNNSGFTAVGVDAINNGPGYAVQGLAYGTNGAGGVFLGGPSGIGVGGTGGSDTTSGGTHGGDGGVFAGGASENGIGGSGVFGYAGSGPVTTGTVVAGVGGITNGSSAGAFGSDYYLSSTGSALVGLDTGVWGDTSSTTAYGAVMGTADGITGVYAENNTTDPIESTIYAENDSTSSTAPVFAASAPFSLSGSAIIGGTGCGANFMGLQLGLQGMSNCSNYTMIGDGNGNTYINSSSSGNIYFRNNNDGTYGNQGIMVINSSGSVTVGALDVTHSLTKPGGSFKIDHPLDPANKYLYHSFVESPDMKNIYDGVTELDASGEAVVILPEWFQALNRDFRYQLTTIGGFAPVYIAQEVANNQFKIAGGKPGIRVSWQVTGIRQDEWANAHRIEVEVEKAPADRGHYLHPELFGAPQTARIGYQAPPAEVPVVAHGKPARTAPKRSGMPAIRPMIRPQPILPKLPIAPPKAKALQASK